MLDQRRYSALIINERHGVDKLHAWFHLRKRLFVDLCGWQLEIVDGVERDAFDTPEATHVLLYRQDQLIGGFRAIRTDRPYLSRSIFPQLASTKPFPHKIDCWEISRFGILPAEHQLEAARVNYALMFDFAQRRGARSLVAVADLSYERFLKTIGITTNRYGLPQVVGRDRYGRELIAVAGEITISEQRGPRFANLIAHLQQVETIDAAYVRGREAIPA